MDFRTRQTSILLDYELVPLRDPQGIYDEGAGHRWAEPDLRQAADALTRLFQERDAGPGLGQKTRQHAREYFGLARIRQTVLGREGLES